MLLPNRHGSSDSYRYGFQGQEKDDEIKGEGNSLNYRYRMHDPRIGRFFATDPLEAKYVYLTPYQFSSNQPIHTFELEGLESNNELGSSISPFEGGYGEFDSIDSEGGSTPKTATQKGNEAVFKFFSDANTGFNDGMQQSVEDKVEWVTEKAPSGEYWNTTLTEFGNDFMSGRTIIAPSKQYEQEFSLALLETIQTNTVYDWSYAAGYSAPDIALGAMGTGAFSLTRAGISGLARIRIPKLKIPRNLFRRSKSQTLYHYTTEEGYNAILESKQLMPSIGAKNARHGSGQYFTDIAPGTTTPGELSARLYRVPWNTKKSTHFFEISTKNLNIVKNKPFNYLNSSDTPLDISRRIKSHGLTF